MKTRFLTLVLLCVAGTAGATMMQAQGAKKSAEKGADKKAPAPKTPADLAYDEFNKIRNEPGAKDQSRFQKLIGAGLTYLLQYPTTGQVGNVVNHLAFYPGSIDKKQPAQRTAYLSLL